MPNRLYHIAQMAPSPARVCPPDGGIHAGQQFQIKCAAEPEVDQIAQEFFLVGFCITGSQMIIVGAAVVVGLNRLRNCSADVLRAIKEAANGWRGIVP